MALTEKVIASRIKGYMAEHGIKQVFLVDKLDVHSSTVSDWLNGRRGINVISYAQICDALDVPLNTFLSER